MKRNFRLTRTQDFNTVKRKGISKHHKLAVLLYVKNNIKISRSAIIASKAVGNAVTRNLIKRRMRACVASEWSKIKPGWDLVFYARKAGIHARFSDLHLAVMNLLLQADLIIDK